VKVLVTGADGFVGRHLCRTLEDHGDTTTPLVGVDIRDRRAVAEALGRARPDAVVHLAAVSSVAESQRDPAVAFDVNTLGTLNVCLAMRELGPGARLLFVSSGEVYGAIPRDRPATEQARVSPMSPYGASKLAAEITCLEFARGYGMNVVIARPFTHLGAGQSPVFAIASFARQLAQAKRLSGRGALRVGNLEAVRDFSHVRDVVAAYRLLLERGVSGEIYNVSSGVGRSVQSVLDELIELAHVDVDVQVDPTRLRPADIPNMVGDASKIRALGWHPRHTVREALLDVFRDVETQTTESAQA
jgi:GDP-4-dehydro-6-deoxy-D-mannose reductase